MRNEYKRLLAFILCLIMIFASVSECFAASKIKSTTVKLSSTSGTVTVKNASGKKQTVKEDMNLYSGYTIKTGKDSYAYVALDKSKAVKIDSLSEIEIRKSGRKLELYIIDGSIFCNVEEKLKSDESLNIRTNTMITGIRGTSVQFDVDGKDFAAKFFDGSGESVDLGTGKKYKIEAGSKFVGGESADGAQGLAKMDNILDELSASAAEEIQGNEELAARIAKTFDTSTTELVNDIKEALPEMKAADQKAQEEKIKELEAAEKASSVVDDALKKSQVAKESEEKSSSGGGGSVTPTPTPTTYTVNLPDDSTYYSISNPKVDGEAVTKNANNVYTVTSGSSFTCTVNIVSGATLQFSEGTYSATAYELNNIQANKTILASANISAVSKTSAEAIKADLETSNTAISANINTVKVTLPANTTDVLTFSVSSSAITSTNALTNKTEYTVVKDTTFEFTFTNASGVEFTATGVGQASGNTYSFTADNDKTIACSVKLSGVNATDNKTALTNKVDSVTIETVKVTLPADTNNILTFTTSGAGITTSTAVDNKVDYTVIKGTDFEFTVTTYTGIEFIATNAGDVSGNSYSFTAVSDKAIACSVTLSGVDARTNEEALTGKVDSINFETVKITLPSDTTGVLTFTASGDEITASNGAVYTVIRGMQFEFAAVAPNNDVEFKATDLDPVANNYYSFAANGDTTITGSVTLSGIHAKTNRSALLQTNGITNIEYDTVEITLPTNVDNIISFTASGAGITTSNGAVYTVIKDTFFGFTVSTTTAGITVTGSNVGTVTDNYGEFVATADESVKIYVNISNYQLTINDNDLIITINTANSHTITFPANIDGVVSYTVSGSGITTSNASINEFTAYEGSKLYVTVETTGVAIDLYNGTSKLTGDNGCYEIVVGNSDVTYTAKMALAGNSLSVPEGSKVVIDEVAIIDNDYTFSGDVEFTNGFIINSNKTVTINEGSLVTVKGNTINNATLNLNGQLILDSGVNLIINSDGVINVASGASIVNNTGASITNNGKIKSDSYVNAFNIVTGGGTYSGTKTFYWLRYKTGCNRFVESKYQALNQSRIASPSNITSEDFVNKVDNYQTTYFTNTTNWEDPYPQHYNTFDWYSADISGTTVSLQYAGPSNSNSSITMPRIAGATENSFAYHVVLCFAVKRSN